MSLKRRLFRSRAQRARDAIAELQRRSLRRDSFGHPTPDAVDAARTLRQLEAKFGGGG